MAEELKNLNVTRGAIKSQLTRFNHYCEALNDSSSVTETKLRLTKFSELWNDFNAVQSQIEHIDDSHRQEQERESFENQYFKTGSLAEKFIATHTHIETPPPNRQNLAFDSSFTPGQTTKPPSLKLPNFSNKYSEWISFSETFTSVIHSNQNLTNLEKLHYLKSCLTGDSAKLIETLSVSNDNYSVAWTLLKNRYENKRLIIQNHVRALCNIQQVQKNSAESLRKLLNEVTLNLEQLRNLEQPVDHWDLLIIENITSKLDYITLRDWQGVPISGDVPTLKELTNFLTSKCRILETMEVGKNHNSSSNGNYNNIHKNSNFRGSTFYKSINSNLTNVATSNSVLCKFCKQGHYLNQCPDLLNLIPKARVAEINKMKLCVNCLRNNHTLKNCFLTIGCKTCGLRHHTILHDPDTDKTEQSYTSNKTNSSLDSNDNIPVSNFCKKQESSTQILLSTAIVRVKDCNGRFHNIRSLLDMGSQSHFISRATCDKLGLKLKSKLIPIQGINQSVSNVNKIAEITIKSQYNEFSADMSCLVLDKITANLPTLSFDADLLKVPNDIQLADQHFNIKKPIDLLIGAQLFWDILSDGHINNGKNKPHLKESKLGWIVGGILNLNTNSNQTTVCNLAISKNIEKQIEKFWEVENYSCDTQIRSQDEINCENHFMTTHERNESGRFVVQLPFKSSEIKLGSSRSQALQRFYSLERKLSANPSLRKPYVEFMNEYKNLGHMSVVKNENINDNTQTEFYLPHHVVIKESSTTTKHRVVFDASAKSSNGTSLNDNLLVGPKIQQDLFQILLRFRTYQYAFAADLIKMFRQILISPEHRNYQRIYWRDNPNDTIQTFTLNTVTYGTSAAPYLATRCLQQLAADEKETYPLAYKAIMRDFYVDDVLTGAQTIDGAIELQNQLISTLAQGGFTLQKWASNDTKLNQNNESNDLISLDKQDSSKILGLIWKTTNDQFEYSIKNSKNQDIITKRCVLSVIAQLFDPLGLVGPVLITAKIILQIVWSLKLDWNDALPDNLNKEWLEFTENLANLNKLKIDRKVIPRCSDARYEVHGFCDASQLAYGACVYIRTIKSNGTISVNLICAKSRIAPLKTITIPRLELSGALLLSKLIDKVKKSLDVPLSNLYYWTDSTIVLAWLAAQPSTWNTFVSNRISEIQNLSYGAEWRHIQSKENPSDLISRGVTSIKLIESQLWWHGPLFLQDEACHWPEIQKLDTVVTPEKRITAISVIIPKLAFLTKYSSYNKLQRVMAYILRFVHNTKNKLLKRSGILTNTELSDATTTILKYIQAREYVTEIQNLKNNRQISKTSNLLLLTPFLDDKLLLRVGGRLKHSTLTYSAKHPILLPSKHYVTKLLIKLEHENNLHAGQEATLSFLRQKYWPISGRNSVRQVIQRCVKCFRAKPTSIEPMMGDLPTNRLLPGRPFIKCGIDFAGPIFIKEGRGRGKRSIKAYIALFVCFATKAVHIELVGDLTTQAFLNSLKRFIARRGSVSDIYSDDATNFKGAERELLNLKNVFDVENKDSTFLEETVKLKINWHFIPPRSPHFGGLWESCVKSIKHYLRRSVGNAAITFEEMHTLLTQIEAILNSRPLTPLSNDPNDLSALTPGHFLVGEPLNAPVEPNITDVKINRLSRWQRIEQLRQHFWKRYSIEYVSQLQQKTKWKLNQTNQLKLGALVLIREDNRPPLLWLLGRVIQTHAGTDGITRVVTLKTTHGTTRRAVTKVCVLPIIDNEV